MVSLEKDRFGRWAEAYLPLTLGALTLAVCLSFRGVIVPTFIDWKLSLPQLYTALFGWASVMTGFLFGVYGLIVGKSDGFIAETRHTQAMKVFLRYTSRAVILGFMLTLTGIPFLVANPDVEEIGWPLYGASCIYVGLFVWSFAATARVAYIFSIIVKSRRWTCTASSYVSR